MATMGAGDVVVHLDGVTIGYDKNKPLAAIPSLKIKNGEILAIAGPSGIGKSTLVKTIAGLVRPLTGDIEVCGVMAPRRPVRGQLGYIPQRLGLIRHASVFHNVLIGSRAKFCGPLDFFASKQAKKIPARCARHIKIGPKKRLKKWAWNIRPGSPSNAYPEGNREGLPQLEHSHKDRN